jgi:hypothetical protein
MDRMLMRDAPHEDMAPQVGRSALRTTLYTFLAIALVAGAWVRFNGQISSLLPALAGPAGQVADQTGLSGRPRGLLELGLLPQTASKEEVAALGLGAADTASLSDALMRRRLRLVHLPVLDISPVIAPGDAGHSVVVSSGGYTRLVRLTRAPVTLTLPIAIAGTITFQSTNGDPVSIGALTLSGPVRLPSLQSGQSLSVAVLAQ